MNFEQAGALLSSVRESVARVVVGQTDVIDQTLATFLARGHALLEGVPGTAKTLLVRAIARSLGARYGRVQFTPDLMPSDVTGVSMLVQSRGALEFRPGPIFTDLLLGDEINRAPPKTQAALLEAMQERQVTVDGVAHPLGELFCVLATQNPVEYEGTYPLPEAQLDRFLLKIRVTYPDRESELRVLDHHAEGFSVERLDELMPPPVADAASCAALRELTATVTVSPEVRGYIATIVRATRDEPAFTLGGSPRASVALLQVSRAAALLAGRDFVTPDDVKRYATPVLRHRVLLAADLEVEGRTADETIAALLSRVPAPQ